MSHLNQFYVTVKTFLTERLIIEQFIKMTILRHQSNRRKIVISFAPDCWIYRFKLLQHKNIQ